MLGLGILIRCLFFFAIFGLLLYPLIGFEAWRPVLESASALSTAATHPIVVWAVVFLVLTTVASFGYYCLSQASSGNYHKPLERLLLATWRLRRLAFSPFIPVSRASLGPAGRALPLHPLARTLASTPSGLSGALPLLI